MNYDKTKYRKLDWKNIIMLHWIINPGLLINELILGQRVPKVTLIERVKNKSFVERSKVPCPHCNTIHNSNTWSLHNKTAFKNWFGLYCPACGGVIPCLMNIGTFTILAVTSPIWYWFRKPLYNKWLAQQPVRYAQLDLEANDFNKKTWWQRGIIWGMVMFAAMTTLNFIQGDPLNWKKLAVGFVVWIIGGLMFGLVLRSAIKKVMNKITNSK